MSELRSMRELDHTDQQLVNEIQRRFPLAPYPFWELGREVGVAEEEAIARVSTLRDIGVLRRLGPIFDAHALGYSSSLVAMRVPADGLRRAAEAVNGHPGVCHSSQRDHEFNLWLTLAVPPGADLEVHVDALHHLAGAESTRMLPALRLFKIDTTADMTGERALDEGSHPHYIREIREAAAGARPTEREIEVIRAVQGDVALVPEPFAAPARELGCSVRELIESLEGMRRRGFLRRFAADLGHREVGFEVIGMAVWRVPEADVQGMGEQVSCYGAISHCCQHPAYDDWPYNLLSMVRARDKGECAAIVERVSRECGLEDYAVLYNAHEYKNVSLRYFTLEWDAWEERFIRGKVSAAYAA